MDTKKNVEGTTEKASTKEHKETGSSQVETEKIEVINLEHEWEQFNKKLQTQTNLEGTFGF